MSSETDSDATTDGEGNGGLTVPTHHRTHEQSPATAANQGAAIVRSKYSSCISSLPRGSNGRGHTCVSGVSGRSVAGSSLPFPGAQRNLEDVSDESDDISCPAPCHVKTETPLTTAPPSNRSKKSKATSAKVSATDRGSSSRDSKTDSKPKKRAVTKASSRGRGKRTQPPRRAQPPARRKKVGKGLQFEDDLSPVQETVSPQVNLSSSSDEDFVGGCLLRSRRKVLQKKSRLIETESEKEDSHCDGVGEAEGPDDTDGKPLQTLPASSIDVSAEASTATTHHLIDELFGGGPVNQEPETSASATLTGDTQARPNMAHVSDSEGSEGPIRDAKSTSQIKEPSNNNTHSDDGAGSSMHGQETRGESSNNSEAVDLDAELFGF